MNKKFVAKSSSAKMILFSLGSLLFAAGGVFMFFDEGWLTKFFGIAALAFFGMGFFVLFFRAFDSRPQILIDEKGIEDRLLGVGRIDWEDIQFVHFRMDSKAKNDAVFLKLKNPEKYLKKLSGTAKMLSKFNGDLEHGIFNLNLANLDTEPQQVYEKILRYVPEKQIGGLDRMTGNQID